MRSIVVVICFFCIFTWSFNIKCNAENIKIDDIALETAIKFELAESYNLDRTTRGDKWKEIIDNNRKYLSSETDDHYNVLQQIMEIPLTTEDMLQLKVFKPEIPMEIHSLKGLEYAENLVELRINSQQISDLSPLGGLKSLWDVNLRGNSIFDLTPLENLENLAYLDVSENHLIEIDFSKLPRNLNSLNVNANYLKNICGVINTPSIMSFMFNQNEVTDIGCIKDKKDWIVLLAGKNYINDISPVFSFSNLESLDISGNPYVGELDFSRLQKLKYVSLGKLKLKEVPRFPNKELIKYLSLEENELTQLKDIPSFSNIGYLNVASNAIKDISYLTGCENLFSINLAENPIRDFSPLLNIKKLNYVAFSNNQKSDEMQVVVEKLESDIKSVRFEPDLN